MEIKDLIRQKRISLGMTMKEVADKVGVSEGTISRWESGEIANMKRGAISSLAKVLQLSPNSIMGWEDEPQEEGDRESYYYDDDVAAIANEMKENPGMRVLFDASRGLKKESIEEVRRFIEFQKARERGDYEE